MSVAGKAWMAVGGPAVSSTAMTALGGWAPGSEVKRVFAELFSKSDRLDTALYSRRWCPLMLSPASVARVAQTGMASALIRPTRMKAIAKSAGLALPW